MMQKQIALLKESDGARGEHGKSKIYQITVKGTAVVTAWGMAEKTSRQTSVKQFWSENAALSYALETAAAKKARGYHTAYSV